MDPITGAVVAAVLYLLLAGPAVWLCSSIGVFLGALIHDDFAGIGMILGWIAGSALGIFMVIQSVIQIVRVVQLII